MNLIEAYASLSRIRDDVTDRVLMFAFKDFGDAKPPMWSRRRELMSSYLIGTQPLDKEVFRALHLYRELEKHGHLSIGPIDLQYREYLKQKEQKEAKAELKKATKRHSIIN